MLDWYEDNIEPEIREVVKTLRNRGVNTTCSCGHGMWVEGDSGDFNEDERLITITMSEMKFNFDLVFIRTIDDHVNYRRFYLNIEPKVDESQNMGANLANTIKKLKYGSEGVPRHLVFLALPYSHTDPAVRETRYKAAIKKFQELTKRGYQVTCLVIVGHSITVGTDLPFDWKNWETFCLTQLRLSWKICVLALDGWEDSVGLTEEIRVAAENGLAKEFV